LFHQEYTTHQRPDNSEWIEEREEIWNKKEVEEKDLTK
jgi:hypothetical protein